MDAALLIPTGYQTAPTGQPQLGRSVTIDQAAALLGVSRRTVYYRIREGRLHTVRTLLGSQRVLISSMPAPKALALTVSPVDQPVTFSKDTDHDLAAD
jgi:excisionase family DNA binding protein